MIEHEGVREAVVFGVPDAVWGESVFACVVPAPGRESNRGRARSSSARARLASFKKPKRVEIVDELPKNAYGKVLRRELKERYKDERIDA